MIDLIDDDEVDFSERDLASALTEVLPQLLAEARADRAAEIRRAIGEEVMRVTGHLGGDGAAVRAWSVGRRARR